MAQLEVLRSLESRGLIEREVASLFHALRRAGNEATHDFVGSRTRAFDHLKLARKLAIWFHRTYGGVDARVGWSPGPFLPPEDHTAKLRELEDELARARAALDERRRDAEAARALAELEAQRRAEAEALAERAIEERTLYAELAEETEARLVESRAQFDARLQAAQVEASALTEQQLNVQRGASLQAGVQLDLDEADTRLLIDDQLRAAGWAVDSTSLRYGLGTRPETGRRLAIAEWPTDSGPADYVLFDGATPLAVVEAKRKRKNVVAAIEQGKRYVYDFHAQGSTLARPDGWEGVRRPAGPPTWPHLPPRPASGKLSGPNVF